MVKCFLPKVWNLMIKLNERKTMSLVKPKFSKKVLKVISNNFSIARLNQLLNVSVISFWRLLPFKTKGASQVKNPPANAGDVVRTLNWEDPPEKEMAPHSSILVWEIPWTEEPGRLQSMGLQKSQS